MKEWLKDHVLELAALVVAIVGVKGLTDFWSRLREMFSLYLAEALFACGLAAITAAIVAVFFIRSWHRRHIAAKDAEIAVLKKRPTQDDLNGLKVQLRAKDAEIEALKNAKMSTRLDTARATLGDDGLKAFRALCAAGTYVDGVPSRPLVFSMNDEKLSVIGLDSRSLLLMEEVGVIRLSEPDERELVGTNARREPTGIGYGVTACADFVRFDLAGGKSVEVKPVRLTFGTDRYVATGLYGADLGIASFTSLGAELAAEYAALNPPLGIVGYIEDAYSANLRESRHHFRSLKEDGRE